MLPPKVKFRDATPPFAEYDFVVYVRSHVVLIYDNDIYCGKLEYGEEFYFYVCKNKFRRDQNDIEFHKVILDEI